MIKRLIQLVLDQAAALKLEKEVDKSMGRIARDSESKLTKAFKRIGAAVIAAFSVRAIVGFSREMLRLGSNAEQTAGKFDAVFGSARAAQLDGFLDRFGRLAGLTRTEGREMLANFGAVFQGAGLAVDASAELSERAVQLAADFQAFHDVPIAETFTAIRSGATGQAEPLKRLGIVLRAVDVDQRALLNSGKENAKQLTEQERVVARMQLIFEKAGAAVGAMERELDTVSARVIRLSTWFRQLREDLAVGLLPVFRVAVIEIGNASGFFDGATAAVQRLTVWIQENLQAIRDWGVVVVRTVQASVETIRFMGRMVINAFDVVGTSLALTWLHIRERFAGLVNFVIEGVNKLPGVDIEFRMNQMTPEEFREQQRLLVADIAGDASDMADALGDLAESYREVGRAAFAAATGQTAALDVPAPEPDVAPHVAPAAAPTVEEGGGPDDEASARWKRQMDALAAAEEAARRFREGELQKLNDAASAVAGGMTDAFTAFFEATAHGFQGQGDVFASAVEAARGAGAAIVGALVEGRAETEMALGTAALASGMWPPNPAAIAAATKHFAAAAMFKAIPGIVRGGVGGFGGGGGASVPLGAIGTSMPGTPRPMGPEVHIYLDPLSPGDERFQRVVMGASQNARERFGENVRVNIHPRTGTFL